MTAELKEALQEVLGVQDLPIEKRHRDTIAIAVLKASEAESPSEAAMAEAFRLPGLDALTGAISSIPDRIEALPTRIAKEVVKLLIPPLLDALITLIRKQKLKLVEDDGV